MGKKKPIPNQSARLENWLRVGPLLMGNVYGHPHLEDGSLIRTSRIRVLSKDQKRAVTLNTTYTLGVPHPDHAKEASHG